MTTAGIIAEYNPFHNGHLYHIEETKRQTGADRVIVVLSGDFVQRGAPAVVNKYVRTRMALAGGADLVLELPVRYAAGSAEYFAVGAVSLLESLGVVETLSFGSECGEIAPLSRIAEILSDEPEEYRQALQKALREGLSYPAARARALLQICPDPVMERILSQPNNILGIEYCRAIRKLHSPLKPFTIRRIGSDYHQTALTADYSSASAIRRALKKEETKKILGQIPGESLDVLLHYLDTFGPADTDDYSLLLKYKLMLESPENLCHFQDVTEDMAHRIRSMPYGPDTFREFTSLIQTKDLTYSRAARALFHILLNIHSYSLSETAYVNAPYARILGFRRSAAPLLGDIKKRGMIPLISKLADRRSLLDGNPLAMLEQDIWCANLYEICQSQRFCAPFTHEAVQKIFIYEDVKK